MPKSKMCDGCKKIINRRIKRLQQMQKDICEDKDRHLVIDQLKYLMEGR